MVAADACEGAVRARPARHAKAAQVAIWRKPLDCPTFERSIVPLVRPRDSFRSLSAERRMGAVCDNDEYEALEESSDPCGWAPTESSTSSSTPGRPPASRQSA